MQETQERVNIFSVAGQTVSIATTQCCNCNTKAAMDNMDVNECEWLYTNKTLSIKTSRGPGLVRRLQFANLWYLIS